MALAVVASRVLRANAEKSLRLDGYPPPDVGVLGSSLGGFSGLFEPQLEPNGGPVVLSAGRWVPAGSGDPSA